LAGRLAAGIVLPSGQRLWIPAHVLELFPVGHGCLKRASRQASEPSVRPAVPAAGGASGSPDASDSRGWGSSERSVSAACSILRFGHHRASSI